MSNENKLQIWFCFAADALSLSVSTLLARTAFGAVWPRILPVYSSGDWVEFGLVLTAAFLAVFLFAGTSGHPLNGGWEQALKGSLRFNLILAAVVSLLLLVTKNPLLESRYLFLGLVLTNLVIMFLTYAVVQFFLNDPHSGLRRRMGRLVGIVTTTDRAPALIRDLRQDWTKNLHGVALLDASEQEVGGTVEGVPVTAGYQDFLTWVRNDALDELYIDIPYESGDSLMPYLHEIESTGINIHLNIPIVDKLRRAAVDGVSPSLSNTLEHRAGSPMITLNSTTRSLSDVVLKRGMDLLGGLVGCIISIPIIAVVAVPLKLESPGPLFFKQKRVGLNGRIFDIYKLRSMYADAEQRKKDLMAQNEMNGLMFKIAEDPRITRVGHFIRRTSIDELPQFFNVLRGDMSLVGTRPPTLDEYERYESHHKRRLSMKPGITGLWQVSGRSDIENFEDVVRLDVQYIDNWSLWLDIKLLFKTVAVVFAGRGAR